MSSGESNRFEPARVFQNLGKAGYVASHVGNHHDRKLGGHTWTSGRIRDSVAGRLSVLLRRTGFEQYRRRFPAVRVAGLLGCLPAADGCLIHEFHYHDGVLSTLLSKSSPEARWSAFCIVGALAAAAALCWLNYRVDLYGLFGKDHDRSGMVYSNERSGKYLLSLRYVPEHCDSLLVGSSVTDNWDTPGSLQSACTTARLMAAISLKRN